MVSSSSPFVISVNSLRPRAVTPTSSIPSSSHTTPRLDGIAEPLPPFTPHLPLGPLTCAVESCCRLGDNTYIALTVEEQTNFLRRFTPSGALERTAWEGYYVTQPLENSEKHALFVLSSTSNPTRSSTSCLRMARCASQPPRARSVLRSRERTMSRRVQPRLVPSR